jgi:hypothetical protein
MAYDPAGQSTAGRNRVGFGRHQEPVAAPVGAGSFVWRPVQIQGRSWLTHPTTNWSRTEPVDGKVFEVPALRPVGREKRCRTRPKIRGSDIAGRVQDSARLGGRRPS